MEDLTLTSSAFKEGETIPSEYTCDGENISPPLSISNVPENAKSLALIVDDSDIPATVKKALLIEKFDHWIVFNIDPTTKEIGAGSSDIGTEGKNSRKSVGYTGACPPTEHEPTEHRYIFQLYALDTELTLSEGASESELRAAMKGHIVAKAELIGVYDRTKTND